MLKNFFEAILVKITGVVVVLAALSVPTGLGFVFLKLSTVIFEEAEGTAEEKTLMEIFMILFGALVGIAVLIAIKHCYDAAKYAKKNKVSIKEALDQTNVDVWDD